MSSPTEIVEQPWSQRNDENARWYQRFSDYLAMGAARSVRGVYNAEKHNDHSKSVPASWSEAAHRHEWQRRAEAYDAWRRAAVFEAGNAADTERVKKLDVLIDQLYDRTIAMLKVAAPDVAYNEKLVASLLAATDAMAKHTGGYAPTKHEITGKDGKAIQVESDEQTTMRVVFYVPEISDVSGNDALDAMSGSGTTEIAEEH